MRLDQYVWLRGLGCLRLYTLQRKPVMWPVLLGLHLLRAYYELLSVAGTLTKVLLLTFRIAL